MAMNPMGSNPSKKRRQQKTKIKADLLKKHIFLKFGGFFMVMNPVGFEPTKKSPLTNSNPNSWTDFQIFKVQHFVVPGLGCNVDGI